MVLRVAQVALAALRRLVHYFQPKEAQVAVRELLHRHRHQAEMVVTEDRVAQVVRQTIERLIRHFLREHHILLMYNLTEKAAMAHNSVVEQVGMALLQVEAMAVCTEAAAALMMVHPEQAVHTEVTVEIKVKKVQMAQILQV